MHTGQTYVAPDGIHFGTEQAEFDTYNFQPQQTIQEIIDFVHTPCPEGHLIELRGPENIGKEYLLRATAYLGSEQRKPTLCTVLQLPQGWNPDESSNTNRFIENLKVTHPYLHDPSYSERLERIKETFQNHQNSIVNAVAITLTATMGIPDLIGSAALNSILSFWKETGTGSHLPFPAEQQFFRFLQRITESNRLLFYVPNGGQKCETVFNWALDHLPQLPNLTIVVGLTPTELTPHYRNHSPKTISLSPYRESEIADLLNEKLRMTKLDPMFLQATAKHTSGYPGKIALLFYECLQQEIFSKKTDGAWQLSTDNHNLNSLSTIFSQGGLFGPIRKYRETLLKEKSTTKSCQVLDNFLRAAAACGEYIPFDIIANFLELSSDDRDWVEDRLTEELQGFFTYHGLKLKDLPNTEVYQWTNPWLPSTIQQALGKELTQQCAKKLARYLSEHYQPSSERVAKLLASVLRTAGKNEELDHVHKLINWWTEQWNSTALKENLITHLQERNLDPEGLWKIINLTQETWPQWRRLVLLEAYAKQPHCLPEEHLIPWLKEMGTCLYDLGKFENALAKHEEAETIQRTTLPPGHPDLAHTLNNLGNCLRLLNRLEEALEKYTEAETIRRTTLPPGHPDLAATLNNLGNCLRDLNRLEKALKKYEEAETIQRTTLSSGHPDLAHTLNNLGNCLRLLNRLEEALGKYMEAETIRRTTLPHGRFHLAIILNDLGSCLRDLNRPEEALEKYTEAETIQRTALSHGHPDLATTLNNLGSCLHALNRLEEGVKKLAEAETIQRAALPHGHPALAITLNNFGGCLQALNRLEEGVKKLAEAETIQRAALPPGHPALATTLSNLGKFLHTLNRLEEALEKYDEAETIQRTTLPPGHPALATTLSVHGSCLHSLNRLEKAIEKLAEAKSIFELLGCGYENIVQAINKRIDKINSTGGKES